MQYKFLPHTADAKFQAFGKTLEEAFKNAAYAMTDIITNHKKVKAKVKETIKIKRHYCMTFWKSSYFFLIPKDFC